VFIERFSQAGFQIVGTHLKTDSDYRVIDYKSPLIILMGNEQAGLTDALAGVCTHLVKIPMRGKADSLNVSVAAAIMLYEVNHKESPC
jgi:TrmH family RNA methyltransferase